MLQPATYLGEWVQVETILIHKSGEIYSLGVFGVKLLKLDPQASCTAVTYLRRYGAAGLGIPLYDDDGNEASSQAPKKTTQKQTLEVEDPCAYIIPNATDKTMLFMQERGCTFAEGVWYSKRNLGEKMEKFLVHKASDHLISEVSR